MTFLPLCQFRLGPISKWLSKKFRPQFSGLGPLQIFSLTSNEVDKTIKPWSPGIMGSAQIGHSVHNREFRKKTESEPKRNYPLVYCWKAFTISFISIIIPRDYRDSL